MSSGLDALMERWTKDEQFRKAVREDPEKALAASGLRLTDEEMAAARALETTRLTDQELEQRISKSQGGAC